MRNYNKLLITINQDILDRFVCLNQEKDNQETRILYKIIDFKPTSEELVDDVIKIQRLFDPNMILLNWRKSQNILSINVRDFLRDYKILDMPEEVTLRQQIYHSRKFWFFISYFADEETNECFPMEIKPTHININDYDINYNHMKGSIIAITNR